jgi:hypothetical protein
MPCSYRHLLLPLLLIGCSSSGAEIAREARQSLVGMRAVDLQACAGIPNRTLLLADGSEMLSYEQANANVGGFNLTLPMVGGFRMAGSGSYCHAIFRVAQGRIIGLNYTGDNDDIMGQEGVCAPIVRGCLRYPEPAIVPTRSASQVLMEDGASRSKAWRALNQAQSPLPANQP